MKFYVQKGYVSKILGFYIPGRTSCKIVSSYTEDIIIVFTFIFHFVQFFLLCNSYRESRTAYLIIKRLNLV